MLLQDKEGLPLTCRAVFIIGPDKKLKLSVNYPASVGALLLSSAAAAWTSTMCPRAAAHLSQHT